MAEHVFSSLVFDCYKNEKGWHRIHMKNSGACVIASTSDNRYLLIKEPRLVGADLKESFVWNLPKGRRDSLSEPFEFCAKRELFEETGLDLELANFKLLGHLYPDNGILCSSVAIVSCDLASEEPLPEHWTPPANQDKIEVCRLFSKDEILQLFATGALTDMFTFAAIFLKESLDAKNN